MVTSSGSELSVFPFCGVWPPVLVFGCGNGAAENFTSDDFLKKKAVTIRANFCDHIAGPFWRPFFGSTFYLIPIGGTILAATMRDHFGDHFVGPFWRPQCGRLFFVVVLQQCAFWRSLFFFLVADVVSGRGLWFRRSRAEGEILNSHIRQAREECLPLVVSQKDRPICTCLFCRLLKRARTTYLQLERPFFCPESGRCLKAFFVDVG